MSDVKEAFEKAWGEFMKDVEVGTIRSLYIKDWHGYRYEFDRESDGMCSMSCGAATTCCEGFKIRMDDHLVDIDIVNDERIHSFVLIPFESIDKIWTHVGVFVDGYLGTKDEILNYLRGGHE